MFDMIGSALRIFLGVYVGLSLLVFFRQSRYVYYPERVVGCPPRDDNLDYRDVRLHTSDGETIAAWYVPAAGASASTNDTVLFCHGNGGNISHRLGSIRTFHDLGFSVLIFDYRGYGESTGKPSEKGTYLDAMAAWDYLVTSNAVAREHILLFGESLGGAVATRLGGQVGTARALFLESSFTSAPDMAKRAFPFLPARLLCRFKYDTLAGIRGIQFPVVIAHSPDDRTIPYEHGQRLFAAAPEPKCFIQLKGDHNDAWFDRDPACQSAFMEFLRQPRPAGQKR